MSCDKDITLLQGEYRRTIETVWVTPAETQVAEKLNLTGCTISLVARAKADDASPAFTVTPTILAQSGDTLGQFEQQFVTATTMTVPAGTYVYETVVVTSAGHRLPVAKGKIYLVRAVNR